MFWTPATRAHPVAADIADRHYNRQSVGSSQFVPPGRCVVLLAQNRKAVWVTSWPLPEFCKHEWAGAWVNSLFRKECGGEASAMILDAVAATRARWADPPALGIVTFVDPRHVPGVKRRGVTIYGYSYLKAGFRHVGFTKENGLWAWQMLPADMPPAAAPVGETLDLYT